MPKQQTTQEKWRQATKDAMEAIAILIEIQTEMKEKLDEIPEIQMNDPEVLTYQEICDLDLTSAYDLLEEALGIVIN
jgi:hypothetical protein